MNEASGGLTPAERQRRRGQQLPENRIGTEIVDSAVTIHRALGPGLMETVYETILEKELSDRGLDVARQVPVRIVYNGMTFDRGFRADLLVEDKVIVELKSVEQVSKSHLKQVQTYLRLSGCKLGYLLNFGAALMKDGITRCVNGLEE